VPVQQRCTGLVEDTKVHGTGVQVAPAVQRVRSGPGWNVGRSSSR
jgi:hypothetical protein